MLIKQLKLAFVGLFAASMTLPVAAPANALISKTSEDSIATSKQEFPLIAKYKYRRRRRYRRPRSYRVYRIRRRRYPRYYRYRKYPKYRYRRYPKYRYRRKYRRYRTY